MNNSEVEVVVQGRTAKWFTEKGYVVPTHTVQLWAKKDGKRVKNGKAVRVKNGTKRVVRSADLPPSSNAIIRRTCTGCKVDFTTRYGAYLRKKESDRCTTCSKKRTKGDGSHGYWVKKLITLNENACCDISGEKDKRFLVLHHLLSRKNGGRNHKDNYVILSANYHLAFHNWNGGMNIPCTKKDYMRFKKQEASQTDILAEDWVILD